jgi:hypothetical protein
MNKAQPCVHVRITVRRVVRHPVVQRSLRSGALMQKHVIRNATLGLVPDAVNDVAFHHAHIDFYEVMHVVQDTASISTMTLVVSALTLAVARRKVAPRVLGTVRQSSVSDALPPSSP